MRKNAAIYCRVSNEDQAREGYSLGEQLEIERVSERTKFGMVGAIKDGHIPVRKTLGFMGDNKKLVINPAESEIVERIFDLYLKVNSYQKISNIFNEEKLLNKYWYDTTIQKILANPLYKGDFVSGARVGNTILYENVVEPIISKKLWEDCQEQTRKNARNYSRRNDYLYTKNYGKDERDFDI